MPAFLIEGIEAPADLALNDCGTPLDVSDDILYVASVSRNAVLRYTLSQTSAVLSARWEGFDGPTRLAVGRWDGRSNGLLYVVDGLAKRVRVFEDNAGSLSLLTEHRADRRTYYSSVAVDHFGQVYLVDEVGSTVSKFTPALEFLDADGGGMYASLASVAIPFGRFEVEGGDTYWAGLDQVFAIERWGETSGAQRRILGLRLGDIVFSPDPEARAVHSSFTLTDPADVRVRILNAQGALVRNLESGWKMSGRKSIRWDRRNGLGEQVAGGSYFFELTATAAYRDDPVTARTRLQLPLYYAIRCGSPVPGDDPFRLQGEPVSWGGSDGKTAVSGEYSVLYQFTGLNPSSRYAAEVWMESGDGLARVQDVRADGVLLAGPVHVSGTEFHTGLLALPQETFHDGEAVLSVNRLGEGSAVVSRIVLKETGVSFGATAEDRVVPSAYSLDQNYPNPFNPSTMLRYALPEPARVVLEVYDIAGREVQTLVEGDKPAGVHEVLFDARHLASGIYLYRLRAGSFTQVRKMTLLK
jgi:hypothetical protein